MLKNLVAISQRVDFIKSHQEFRDSLDHRLIKYVSAAGYIPSLIPNVLGADLSKYIYSIKPNFIILFRAAMILEVVMSEIRQKGS